jgi:phospholipid/cholesterol/gamma-HCH transport system permease protein
MPLSIEQSRDDSTVELQLEGELDRESAPQLYDVLRQLLASDEVRDVMADFSGVTDVDSAGIALFSVMDKQFNDAQKKLKVQHLSGEPRRAFEIMPTESVSAEPAEPNGFLENMGEMAVAIGRESEKFYDTLTDIYVSFWNLVKGERPPKDSFTEQSIRIGVDALPIISLLSLLLGLTIAFQSAYQLRQFGANIYVVNLVGISMLREFGPLIVGILLAGRSGSSIAAELATMKVQEEVDALRVMGIAPNRYLLLPRMLALLVVGPLLTVIADIVGLIGGLIISMLYLKLSIPSFWNQLTWAVTEWDFINGMIKSVIFAWIIGSVSCYTGLSARGGASEVGKVTTRAVVVSIFLIIVADSLVTTITTFT